MKSAASMKLVCPKSPTSGGAPWNRSFLLSCLSLTPSWALNWIKGSRYSVLRQKINWVIQNVSVSLTFSCSFLIFVTLQIPLPLSLHGMWFHIVLRSSSPLLLPSSYSQTHLHFKVVTSYVQISRVLAALRNIVSNFKMIYHCNLC